MFDRKSPALMGWKFCSGMVLSLVSIASVQAAEVFESPVALDGVPAFKVLLTPVNSVDGDGGAPRGTCPPVERTYTDPSLFGGGTVNLQAGLVETEIAAASYVVPAAEFPIRIDRMEILFGTQNATVQTVTQWSVIVWEGTPSTGSIVTTYSSDDLILPHIRVGPGTAGVVVDVQVDPGDPEQIFVSDNGSHTFSVGFRVDAHNNPPTTTCSCGLGNLPAVCCPPPPAMNAFPATDMNGISSTANNWLFARACPGATGLCSLAGSGWRTTSSAGITGDWVLRATYTPLVCPGVGACCTLSTGGCQSRTQAACESLGDTWQGEGTLCTPSPCPQPTGACCRINGTCTDGTSAPNCTALGEEFTAGATCVQVFCPAAEGACCLSDGFSPCQYVTEEICTNSLGGAWQGAFVDCVASTCVGACCFGSGCAEFTLLDCTTAGGVFQGTGVACSAGNVCPQGACCLASGSCVFVTELACNSQSGLYQGTGTACGTTNCPQPSGACCLSNGNCLVVTQANCLIIPGASWAGAATTCPGACQPACPAADGDMNDDGAVNGKDIPLFTTALLGGGSQDDICHGDFNNSSVLDVGDINGMVAELLAGP